MNIGETVTNYPITAIVKPPPQIVTPPPLPKNLSTPLPIVDSTGLSPIANQELVGGKYIRLDSSNKNKFLEISKTTNPELLIYYQKFQKPQIVNIVDTAANNALDFNGLLQKYRPQISAGLPLANFGNSCYFGSVLQLLYAMNGVSQNIMNNNIFTSPLAQSIPQKQKAYDNVKKLLNQMNRNYNSSTIQSFPEYLSVKAEFTPTPAPQEEDAEEFLTRFTSELDDNIRKKFFTTGDGISYHAITSVVLSNSPASQFIFEIKYNNIAPNPNATIEEVMTKAYADMNLLEGSDAIYYNNDYVFGYRFYDIKTIPQYLVVQLHIGDDISPNKKPQNIQINRNITLSACGITKTYIMLGIVIHIGQLRTGGHYTSLIFNRYNPANNSIEYTYYDDATTRQVTIPANSTIIPKNTYILTPNHNAYLVLYGDITNLL